MGARQGGGARQHFHFRVPLFQTVMQGAALARTVAQSEPAGSEVEDRRG
jgi:hypothetical protein